MAKYDRNLVLLQLPNLHRWRRLGRRRHDGDASYHLVDQTKHEIRLPANVILRISNLYLMMQPRACFFEAVDEHRIDAFAQLRGDQRENIEKLRGRIIGLTG